MSDTVDIKKQIIDDMLETLKQQVSRYKNLVNSSDVTLEQLKDFDNQIGEIYDTLQKVSNTELTLLINDIEEYKKQLEAKLLELDSIIENIDISSLTVSFDLLTQEQKDSLKGENGLNAYQIAVNEGFQGTESEWLESLKGSSGTFETLTAEQKALLKGEKGDKGEDGQNGLSAYQIAVNEGFEGTESEWLESLKGSGGGSVIYPIPFENIGTETIKLSDELMRLSQGLGQLQGQVGSVNLNQLNGEFQGIKSNITGLTNQFTSLTAFLTDRMVINPDTGEEEIIEGLISKVDKLYAQYTPPDGGE